MGKGKAVCLKESLLSVGEGEEMTVDGGKPFEPELLENLVFCDPE